MICYLFFLLVTGGYCGGKVIRHGGSGVMDSGMSSRQNIPALPGVLSRPGGYFEYFGSGSSSLQAIDSAPELSSEMSFMPTMQDMTVGGYRYGRNIGFSGEGDSNIPLNFPYHGRHGGLGRRFGGGSIVSGYIPRRFHYTSYYRYNPRSHIYHYPSRYLRYNYRAGDPDFFITGKSGDDSPMTTEEAMVAEATAAEMEAANEEAEVKAMIA